MRVISLALAALLLFAAALPGEIAPESGAFFLQGFSSKTYGAQRQNWAVVQDRRGVIYVGNSGGLLEYDGQEWRFLALPKISPIRSLAINDKGTIFVGGQGEFGFLQPDETGTLRYVSLLPHVDQTDRVFKDVWSILNTPSGIVFSSYQRLFRWSADGRMQVWRDAPRFSPAFLVDGVPYLIKDGSGLCRLINDSLINVPGGQIFSRANALRSVVRFRGSLLVITPEAIFVQQGDRFDKYRTEAEALIRESRIYTSLPLKDEILAIGTEHRGLVLLDSQGALLRTVARDSGLLGNSVNAIYRDREGGLWLAQNSGIARVDVERPATRFADHEGIQDSVLSITRHDGTIYAGTMAGLYRLVTVAGNYPHFELVPGTFGQITSLLSTKDQLLTATPSAVYAITKNGVLELPARGAIADIQPSFSDSSTVYAAGRNGLFCLRFDGSGWKLQKHFQTSNQDFQSVVEASNGDVWVTTRSDVWRFKPGSKTEQIDKFSTSEGVPLDSKKVYRIRDSVILASDKGLLRFDAGRGRFIPDHTFDADSIEIPRSVSLLRETEAGDVWMSGEAYHGVFHKRKSGGYSWEPNPLGSSGIGEIVGLYFEASGAIWASGTDGTLIRYQQASAERLPLDQGLKPLLRQVSVIGSDRTVFGGIGQLATEPTLRHSENRLHFEFAAPLFSGTSATDFRVQLNGLDHAWSRWALDAHKEYANLWEGHYVFQVQARDYRGRISPITGFAFNVRPPFYRQWWAYLLYSFLLFGSVWLLTKWRLSAIEESNRRLEKMIEERTEEIRKQRDEIKGQHDEIKAQHDEIKAQEEKTESLLLNILPATIAEELRTTGVVQPLTCDNITVCFTDFVGFTLSSEKMPACDLVAALDEYFSEFDRIVDRYGLEKLKTIGDSYMFVGGLPSPKDSHAVDAVMAALDIVEAVKRRANSRPGWQIRVGLHSGPVIAGVVGFRKFAFDIWGETVNFASRHESSGTPNCVNISEQTYQLVRDVFHCEPRGPIRIKEGRCLEMYLARCVREG